MDCYQHSQDPPPSSSEEDEVTFLLRLKPAPTPPTRRRKTITTPQPNVITTPKGWDVIIERRDVSSPNSSSVCSSPVKQRRCSLEGKGLSRGSYQVEEKHRASFGNGNDINYETGEVNLSTAPFEDNFRCSNVFSTSPYVKVNSVVQRNLSRVPHMDCLVNIPVDVTEEEEPPPIPPRFRPSAPPQEPDDNYCWWVPRPANWSGGYVGCGDENRVVTGFSNYNMFPNVSSIGSPNPNTALNLQYDPTLHSRPSQRQSIIQSPSLTQSISTYSIARPLSASGFYIGSGPSQVLPFTENGKISGIDYDSSGNLLSSGYFSPLSPGKASPVVGRPPKPVLRSSLMERNDRNDENSGKGEMQIDCRVSDKVCIHFLLALKSFVLLL